MSYSMREILPEEKNEKRRMNEKNSKSRQHCQQIVGCWEKCGGKGTRVRVTTLSVNVSLIIWLRQAETLLLLIGSRPRAG